MELKSVLLCSTLFAAASIHGYATAGPISSDLTLATYLNLDNSQDNQFLSVSQGQTQNNLTGSVSSTLGVSSAQSSGFVTWQNPSQFHLNLTSGWDIEGGRGSIDFGLTSFGGELRDTGFTGFSYIFETDFAGTFAGNFTRTITGSNIFGAGFFDVGLYLENGTKIFEFNAGQTSSSGSFSFELAASTYYELVIFDTSNINNFSNSLGSRQMTNSGTFSISLPVTDIPEPHTTALLALGMIVLAFKKKPFKRLVH